MVEALFRLVLVFHKAQSLNSCVDTFRAVHHVKICCRIEIVLLDLVTVFVSVYHATEQGF